MGGQQLATIVEETRASGVGKEKKDEPMTFPHKMNNCMVCTQYTPHNDGKHGLIVLLLLNLLLSCCSFSSSSVLLLWQENNQLRPEKMLRLKHVRLVTVPVFDSVALQGGGCDPYFHIKVRNTKGKMIKIYDFKKNNKVRHIKSKEKKADIDCTNATEIPPPLAGKYRCAVMALFVCVLILVLCRCNSAGRVKCFGPIRMIF